MANTSNMQGMEIREIGTVTDYFAHVDVAALKLTFDLRVGDRIKIMGHTTNFEQEVESMQISNKSVEEAKAGDEIGIKVDYRVRKHDKVYLIL